MLRESIKADGQTIDLEGLADPNCKEIAGLKHSKVLIEYADVFMSRDAEQLASIRDKLEKEMGANKLVDASGVASNFQRMVRIADGSGTSVQEVNNLLRQFNDMRKMMKTVNKMGGMQRGMANAMMRR